VPSGNEARYTLLVTRTAARQIAERLPEAVAAAVMNFITGDLLNEPRRVGKALGQELAGTLAARRGEYRVLYEIDDEAQTVTVLDVDHRRDIYRRG
jgi:mRNA interferase RelE/StbE